MKYNLVIPAIVFLACTLAFAQQDQERNRQRPDQPQPPAQQAPAKQPPAQAPARQSPAEQRPQHTQPIPQNEQPRNQQQGPRHEREQQPRAQQAPRQGRNDQSQSDERRAEQQPQQRQQSRGQQPTEDRGRTGSMAVPRGNNQDEYRGPDRNREQPPVPRQGAQLPPGRDRNVERGDQRQAWQQARARDGHSERQTWRQRGGYTGYRIPNDHFRAHFGREHGFYLGNAPVIVEEGFTRFQYDGYWFALDDPIPEYWGPDWYDSDEVYVDYDPDGGGYYLYDTRYPDDRLAVTVFAG